MERAPILPGKCALRSCGLTTLGGVGSIKEILFVVGRRCGLAHRAPGVGCCAEPVKSPPPVPHSIALVLKKLRGREPNSRRSIGVMLQNFETVTAASERIDPRNCFGKHRKPHGPWVFRYRRWASTAARIPSYDPWGARPCANSTDYPFCQRYRTCGLREGTGGSAGSARPPGHGRSAGSAGTTRATGSKGGCWNARAP